MGAEDDFISFADKVYNHWNSLVLEDEPYCLYLLTAFFEKDEKENVKHFKGTRKLVISKNILEV